MSDAAIVLAPKTQLVSVEDFMPVFTVEQAVQRKQMINQFIEGVMRENEDFGIIPGGQQKPVLLKPGAEKLCSIFGLAPRYVGDHIVEDWSGAEHDGEPFLFYRVRCQLWRGDRIMGEASGSCNSWEQKYRWRESRRLCPKCSAEAIIAGKPEYGGGWLCWQKRGGCGAKFAEADQSIIGQHVGRVPNPDVADQANTILKMAQKRALVAAVLVVTNCSDAFTQDLEETPPIDTGGHPVGTQAAANHVRDKKIAESRLTKTGRPDPRGEAETRAGSPEGHSQPSPTQSDHPTLQAMLDAVAKPGNVKLTFDLIKQQLLEAMPANGEAEYTALLKHHGIQAGAKLDQLRACLTDIWNLISFAREQAAKTAIEAHLTHLIGPGWVKPEPFQATDDDLPFDDSVSEYEGQQLRREELSK